MKTERLILVAAILAAAYFAGRHLRPKPALSIDAQEALAPPPPTTEGPQDNLTPSDLNNGFYVMPLPQTESNVPSGSWFYPEPNPGKPGGQYTPPQRHRKRRRIGGIIMPTDIVLGTANIKNFPDMPPNKVEADARTIGRRCTIWGGQEIQPGEDTSVVLKGLQHAAAPWTVDHAEHETPIFARADLWETFDPYAIKFDRPNIGHHAQQPFGAATSVAVKSKRHPDMPAFALVNVHLLNKAYNGSPINRSPAARTEWNKEFSEYRDVILYHSNKGRTVFFVGDFNRMLPPPPLAHSRYLHLAPGIDHIGVYEHAHSVQFKMHGNPSGSRYRLNSDHDLRTVFGSLSA